jgi:hypothetical protein
MPKSSTHQKVVKNGVEGWIVKSIWDEMLKKGNTEGFHAVASEPHEVMVIRQKTKVAELEPVEESVDSELTGEIEVKRRGRPSVK